MNDLTDLFDGPADRGAQQMMQLVMSPDVGQITCDAHDRIVYVDSTGPKRTDRVFAGAAQYISWVNQLMQLTDVGYTDIETARTSVVEGSFRADRIPVQGSIHVCTREITRGEPAVTVRKQPRGIITLDQMLETHMMSADMRLFLEQAVRARSNILISGGSGAGKTTLARALSQFIDPAHRVITVEEIDELHLSDRLPNVVALTTHRLRDEDGRLLRETSLDDLVRESLRMRGDRVWVGETRGKEAYALVKACNSGHDGSTTTLHSDSARAAIRTAVTYVMESGLPEDPAREQVAQAFDLVVQIKRVKMGRRAITEITEVENVLEGKQQRLNQLYGYDDINDRFHAVSQATQRLATKWAHNGVNYHVAGR